VISVAVESIEITGHARRGPGAARAVTKRSHRPPLVL